MKRPIALAAILLALVAVAVLLVRTTSLGLPGSGSETASLLRVERGDLVLNTEITGTLRSTDSTLLGPPSIPSQWNYKIAFMAPEGADVKAGMPVLRFDASDLERQLQEKVAERDSAATELEKKAVDLERTLRDMELQLAQARANLKRSGLKVDVPADLQAAQDLDEARLDRDLAVLEVASLEKRLALERQAGEAEISALREKRDRAEARVAEMREYIGRMTVTAPRAGTVIYVTDWRGEKFKVGDDVWQARKILEIPDLRSMEAVGHVDEADAGRVAEGQPVALRLDAHPDTAYRGRVAEIARTVSRRDRGNPLKQVELTIALEETDTQRMRPGMRFRGDVEVARVEDAVLAPAEAVLSTAEGAVAFRKTVLGAERVSPEVGRRNAEHVEILAGLSPGDVLVRPEEELR